MCAFRFMFLYYIVRCHAVKLTKDDLRHFAVC